MLTMHVRPTRLEGSADRVPKMGTLALPLIFIRNLLTLDTPLLLFEYLL